MRTRYGVTLKFSAGEIISVRDAAQAREEAAALREIEKWVGYAEADIARDLVPEIQSRLEFLEEVGLGYLTLDRGAPTLSGGEAQRIRLAAQLGSNLQGVCYVLDEPTIGLHARDNQILLNALHKLGDKGNTLVVVEHDEDTIRRADHIIDIGPSAGKRGGRLVAQGSVADVQAAEDSQTGRYLLHAMRHPLQARRAVAAMDLVAASARPESAAGQFGSIRSPARSGCRPARQHGAAARARTDRGNRGAPASARVWRARGCAGPDHRGVVGIQFPEAQPPRVGRGRRAQYPNRSILIENTSSRRGIYAARERARIDLSRRG